MLTEPWIIHFSSLARNGCWSWSCQIWVWLSLILSDGSFLQLLVVSSHAWAKQHSTEYWRRTTCKPPKLPLCCFHLYGALSSKCHLPWLLETPSLVSSTQRNLQILPGFLLHKPQPENFLQEVNWVNHRAYLICFLSLKDHCFLLIPYLDCHSVIYFL